MLEVQPKDSRGYFMLPQAPEDAGYYVYGTPENGAGQDSHPALLSVLFFIEREWQAIDSRKFGIGNISLAGGGKYGKHYSHQVGLQVDVRAIRLDGQQLRVDRFHHSLYDQKATAKLIALFRTHPSVTQILFNDTEIPGVKSWEGHDDHFHEGIRAVVKDEKNTAILFGSSAAGGVGSRRRKAGLPRTGQAAQGRIHDLLRGPGERASSHVE